MHSPNICGKDLCNENLQRVDHPQAVPEHADNDTEEGEPVGEVGPDLLGILGPGVAESGDAQHPQADHSAADKEQLLFLQKKMF